MSQSWWKSLAWQVYAHLPPETEYVAKFGMSCRACYWQRRVPVNLLRGTSHAGAPATVLAAGNLDALRCLTQHVFAEPPAAEVVGEFPWWTLRQNLQPWQAKVDLTVANVPRLAASWIAGRDYLVVPEWVSMHLPVPEDLKELSRASGSVRDDLRIVRRNGLTHSQTSTEAAIDEFYERMYVPFIRQRHGATAFVRSLRHLRVLGRRGGVLWIERGGQRIAGLLYQLHRRRLRALAIGTLDGDYRYVKDGAMAAIYVAALTHAREHACAVVDFGGTRPLLTDGLFRYKRKWGGTVLPNRDCFFAFLVHWGQWNGVVADFLARTGLVFANGKQFDAVRVIGDGQSASAAHHDCWIAGLRQLYLIHPAGWPNVDAPPRTALIGPATTANLLKECGQ